MKIRGEKKKSKPCKKCGCEERYVSNGTCPRCLSRLAEAWEEKNHKKVSKYRQKSYQKRKYGVAPDADLTAKRRAIEERRELRELGI